MTTFQAVLYGILQGFSEFLPIGGSAHQTLLPFIVGWPLAQGIFAGALKLGSVLALLIYFRHDWASIVSSFLQVLIFRKRPMTLDERMPFFLMIATAPVLGSWYYFHESFLEYLDQPLYAAAGLGCFAVPLLFSERMSRRNKGMFDWNWLDAAIVGATTSLMWVPGSGRMTGTLLGANFRNYNRESAAKFTFYLALPLLIASTHAHFEGIDFHASRPMEDLSWLNFAIALIVSTLAGLLAIGSFMRNTQRKGLGGYAAWRIFAALLVFVVYWYRSRTAA
jgi:undecaprenyl-diphosphatase